MSDMPNPETQKALGAIEEWGQKMMGVVNRRDDDLKRIGEASTETAQKTAKLEAEFKTLQELAQEAKDSTDQIAAKLDAAVAMPEEAKSVGQRFVESEEYKLYTSQDSRGNSRAMEVGYSLGDPQSEMKTTFTGASLANRPTYMYQTPRVADYLADPNRSMFVRSLIPTFGTGAGAVEFVRESIATGFTNNADVVPEFAATDSTNKPESAIDFEVISVPVRTIAHFIPLTRQIVDDARQLRGYIENRLIYGLRLKEDQQLLWGTGASNQVQGIMTDSDRQTYSQGSETKIDAIRYATALAYVGEYAPSGVVVHHNDWRDIELLKGTDNHYIWVNVTQDNVQRMWGLPVVPTNAMTAGRALVGDFARGSAIHDRENATVRLSDSHSDFFTKNLWAVLAEERLAQTVYLPKAFVDITFA